MLAKVLVGVEVPSLPRALSHDTAVDFHRLVAFIGIDADHSYEAISKDWENWFPKVRRSRIIALHEGHIQRIRRTV